MILLVINRGEISTIGVPNEGVEDVQKSVHIHGA